MPRSKVQTKLVQLQKCANPSKFMKLLGKLNVTKLPPENARQALICINDFIVKVGSMSDAIHAQYYPLLLQAYLEAYQAYRGRVAEEKIEDQLTEASNTAYESLFQYHIQRGELEQSYACLKASALRKAPYKFAGRIDISAEDRIRLVAWLSYRAIRETLTVAEAADAVNFLLTQDKPENATVQKIRAHVNSIFYRLTLDKRYYTLAHVGYLVYGKVYAVKLKKLHDAIGLRPNIGKQLEVRLSIPTIHYNLFSQFQDIFPQVADSVPTQIVLNAIKRKSKIDVVIKSVGKNPNAGDILAALRYIIRICKEQLRLRQELTVHIVSLQAWGNYLVTHKAQVSDHDLVHCFTALSKISVTNSDIQKMLLAYCNCLTERIHVLETQALYQVAAALSRLNIDLSKANMLYHALIQAIDLRTYETAFPHHIDAMLSLSMLYFHASTYGLMSQGRFWRSFVPKQVEVINREQAKIPNASLPKILYIHHFLRRMHICASPTPELSTSTKQDQDSPEQKHEHLKALQFDEMLVRRAEQYMTAKISAPGAVSPSPLQDAAESSLTQLGIPFSSEHPICGLPFDLRLANGDAIQVQGRKHYRFSVNEAGELELEMLPLDDWHVFVGGGKDIGVIKLREDQIVITHMPKSRKVFFISYEELQDLKSATADEAFAFWQAKLGKVHVPDSKRLKKVAATATARSVTMFQSSQGAPTAAGAEQQAQDVAVTQAKP